MTKRFNMFDVVRKSIIFLLASLVFFGSTPLEPIFATVATELFGGNGNEEVAVNALGERTEFFPFSGNYSAEIRWMANNDQSHLALDPPSTDWQPHTMMINFQASTPRDPQVYAAGEVEIRVPLFMMENRDGDPHGPIDVTNQDFTLIPSSPANDPSNFGFYRTVDEENGYLVFRNHRSITTAEMFQFNVTYLYRPSNVEDGFEHDLQVTVTYLGARARVETSNTLTLDFTSRVTPNDRSKVVYGEPTATWNEDWGTIPEDAEGRFFVTWQIHLAHAWTTTMPWEGRLTEIPGTGGELVAFRAGVSGHPMESWVRGGLDAFHDHQLAGNWRRDVIGGGDFAGQGASNRYDINDFWSNGVWIQVVVAYPLIENDVNEFSNSIVWNVRGIDSPLTMNAIVAMNTADGEPSSHSWVATRLGEHAYRLEVEASGSWDSTPPDPDPDPGPPPPPPPPPPPSITVRDCPEFGDREVDVSNPPPGFDPEEDIFIDEETCEEIIVEFPPGTCDGEVEDCDIDVNLPPSRPGATPDDDLEWDYEIVVDDDDGSVVVTIIPPYCPSVYIPGAPELPQVQTGNWFHVSKWNWGTSQVLPQFRAGTNQNVTFSGQVNVHGYGLSNHGEEPFRTQFIDDNLYIHVNGEFHRLAPEDYRFTSISLSQLTEHRPVRVFEDSFPEGCNAIHNPIPELPTLCGNEGQPDCPVVPEPTPDPGEEEENEVYPYGFTPFEEECEWVREYFQSVYERVLDGRYYRETVYRGNWWEHLYNYDSDLDERTPLHIYVLDYGQEEWRFVETNHGGIFRSRGSDDWSEWHQSDYSGETDLGTNAIAVKVVHNNGQYRVDFNYSVTVQLRPTERVLDLIGDAEAVQFHNFVNLQIFDYDDPSRQVNLHVPPVGGNNWLIDNIPGATEEARDWLRDDLLARDEAFYGGRVQRARGMAVLTEWQAQNWARKDVLSNQLDPNYNGFRIRYGLSAAQTQGSNTENTRILGLEIREGVFFDLLPAGSILDHDSIAAWMTGSSGPRNRPIEPTEVIVTPNFRGSGQTMIEIHLEALEGEENIGGMQYPLWGGWWSGHTGFMVEFDVIYSFEAIQDHGNNVRNVAAFQPRDNTLSPNQRTGTNESNLPAHADDASEHANFTPRERELMSNLAPEIELDEGQFNTVYMQANTPVSMDVPTNAGFAKSVRAHHDLEYVMDTWSIHEFAYHYRLRFQSSGNLNTTNLVMFDVLEVAHGVNEYWQGDFAGIDVTQPYLRHGIEAIVYYSTMPGYVPGYNDGGLDPVGNPDHADLTNEEIWSTEPPADLSEVTAVAIDLTYDVNGNVAVIPANSSVIVNIHMTAPESHDAPLAYNMASYRAIMRPTTGLTHQEMVLPVRYAPRTTISLPGFINIETDCDREVIIDLNVESEDDYYIIYNDGPDTEGDIVITFPDGLPAGIVTEDDDRTPSQVIIVDVPDDWSYEITYDLDDEEDASIVITITPGLCEELPPSLVKTVAVADASEGLIARFFAWVGNLFTRNQFIQVSPEQTMVYTLTVTNPNAFELFDFLVVDDLTRGNLDLDSIRNVTVTFPTDFEWDVAAGDAPYHIFEDLVFNQITVNFEKHVLLNVLPANGDVIISFEVDLLPDVEGVVINRGYIYGPTDEDGDRERLPIGEEGDSEAGVIVVPEEEEIITPPPPPITPEVEIEVDCDYNVLVDGEEYDGYEVDEDGNIIITLPGLPDVSVTLPDEEGWTYVVTPGVESDETVVVITPGYCPEEEEIVVPDPIPDPVPDPQPEEEEELPQTGINVLAGIGITGLVALNTGLVIAFVRRKKMLS